MDSVPLCLYKAIELAEKEKNDTAKYEAYIDLVNFCGVRTLQRTGDSLFEVANRIITHERFRGKLFIAYGYFHKESGNYKKALDYLLKAYDTGLKTNDYFILCGSTLNISRIYKAEQRYDLAIEYCNKSIEFGKKGKLFDRLESCYNQLAAIYKFTNNFHESERYYFLVRDIVNKNNDKWGMIVVNNNLGNLYAQWKKYYEAEILYKKNLFLSKETNNDEMYYYSLFELSNLYFDDNKTIKAKDNIDQALKGMQYLQNNLDMHDVYWHAYRVYKAVKDIDKALLYHEKWKEVSDTLHKMNTDKLLMEVEAKFRNKDKQEQIENLNDQNSTKQTEINRKNNFLVVSVIFIVIILVSLGTALRIQSKLKQTKQKLELKNIQIQQKQKEIVDSINYAKRIQLSLMPTEKYLEKSFEKLKDKN
jgi:tetratricopeptide (TPR) repeat protein